MHEQYIGSLALQPRRLAAVRQVQRIASDQVSSTVVLVVGDLQQWRRTDCMLPDPPDFIFAVFDDVTAVLLKSLCPSLVLSDLIADDFDATDLAKKLSSLGFAGQYRAVSNGLPNPLMVLKEVRMIAPTLDFNLLNGTDDVRLAVQSKIEKPMTRTQFRTEGRSI